MALLLAAGEGDVHQVGALLEGGTCPDLRGPGHDTPLHHAAFHGHTRVVCELLRQGADPTAVDDDGATPLHCAAGSGHVTITEALLQAGADPTAVTKRGNTILHEACEEGQLQVVKMLVETCGADQCVRSTNQCGQVPCDVARFWGHTAVVEYLSQAELTTGGHKQTTTQCQVAAR